MNKENNKNAAGLRRSAIAERIRLREEWSALKGPESEQPAFKQRMNILKKHQSNVKAASTAVKTVPNVPKIKENRRNMHLPNDTLRGVVALVEVGTECRALPLRAALSALGASVIPSWSPLVTHLVWTEGGCRATRAKARALASRLVSPLWVEACAASSRRLPEQAFPAAARASDLPSPRTLRRLLKKAEMENIPITDLLSDSNEENKRMPRLRISSETEQDTSADVTTDTSRDTTHNTSHDKSADTSRDTTTDTTGIESRVNTAPRRALPKTSSISPERPAKSRRKLFTQKEAELIKRRSDDSDDSTTIPKPIKPSVKSKPTKGTMKPMPQPTGKLPITQKDRRELARAERMAKKILAGCTPIVTHAPTAHRPRIVLTGMCRTERRAITIAVKSLKGRIQSQVDRQTTHVLLGSCAREEDDCQPAITGIANLSPEETSRVNYRSQIQKARTLNALCGAARGCRVLYAQWALDSKENDKWLHHSGYEVPHLKKICQKARLERAALGKVRSEYAYDVFNGMRVRISPNAEQRDAAIQLLNLCGAEVQDKLDYPENDLVQNARLAQNNGLTQNGKPTQNSGRTQNGGLTQNTHEHTMSRDYDIKIGKHNGDVSSKWVFDSVAAGRMRTTRRYVVDSLQDSDLVTRMERFQC